MQTARATIGGQIADLRAGRAWATNAALCLMGLTLVVLSRQFVSEGDHFTIGFDVCSELSAMVFVAAAVIVLTQPVNCATLWIVLGFALAMRMTTLFAEPFASSDMYRYVWDGIVQHAHISPYRYVPGNAALNFLHGPGQDGNAEIFQGINRRDYAVTIYPPVAQMVYWLATWFSPTLDGMKFMMFLFECVAVGALLALLRRMGRPAAQVLIYAWCPLLVWEIGGGGHVDAVVIGFVALALLMRHRDQPGLTGLFLGLAVMTKFYPLVLLPALWMRREGRLGEWKLPAALLTVIVGGYALYSSAGMKVFGFLGGYAQEEGLNNGTRFFLLDLVQTVHGLTWVSKGMFLAVCVVVMGALSWWGWKVAAVERFVPDGLGSSTHVSEARRGAPGFLKGCMMLGLAMMLLFSPHYPWYIVWLIPFFALMPNLTLLTYLMAFFYLFTTALADPGPKMFLLNKILYGAVLAAFLLEMTVLRRWPLRRLLHV